MPVRKIEFELSATNSCWSGDHFGQVVCKKQYHATNRLAYVTDGAAGANYNTDIDNQATDNYKYDAVGNLIEDAAEEIAAIEWNANGKIKSIQRTATSNKSDLEFVYDAAGNRIIKIVKPRDGAGLKSQLHWTYTYYVRDANGNVMAVYQRSFQHLSDADYNDQLNCAELHLYGSKRVGTNNVDSLATYTFTDASFTDNYGNTFGAAIYDALPPVTPCTTACKNNYRRKLGKKQYEITNHLGNVLATVSDRRLSKDVYSYTTSGSGNYKYDAVRNMYYAVTAGTGTHNRITSSSDNKTDWYTADVISYSDYYAYGEQQHGRFGGQKYRYDFNNKETDAESDLQDYGMRIYNARLGRFLSVDPITAQYPMLTPYQFASNTPIMAADLDGLEADVKTVAPEKQCYACVGGNIDNINKPTQQPANENTINTAPVIGNPQLIGILSTTSAIAARGKIQNDQTPTAGAYIQNVQAAADATGIVFGLGQVTAQKMYNNYKVTRTGLFEIKGPIGSNKTNIKGFAPASMKAMRITGYGLTGISIGMGAFDYRLANNAEGKERALFGIGLSLTETAVFWHNPVTGVGYSFVKLASLSPENDRIQLNMWYSKMKHIELNGYTYPNGTVDIGALYQNPLYQIYERNALYYERRLGRYQSPFEPKNETIRSTR